MSAYINNIGDIYYKQIIIKKDGSILLCNKMRNIFYDGIIENYMRYYGAWYIEVGYYIRQIYSNKTPMEIYSDRLRYHNRTIPRIIYKN